MKFPKFVNLTARLLVLIVVFYLGTRFGFFKAKAMAKAGRRQTIAIQQALDQMTGFQGTNHMGPPSGSEREFSHAVAEALFGRNSSLNASNIVMIIVAPEHVQGGLLVDFFGVPYQFQYVKLDQMNPKLDRIMVFATAAEE